jgi:molybdenum cofactor synthesis domain-containing protein
LEKKSLKIEIISIGNELLIGKIVNTNATWLAKRVTLLGSNISTITTVGDVIEEIVRAINQAISQTPEYILITGGLGPTYDDMTLEGVAKALGRGLEVNMKALDMVREKYQAYHREGRMEKVTITPARKKMAILPEKSTPISNPVGTAPAVKIEAEGSTIICLPGVPAEMKAIFEESLAQMITKDGIRFYEKTIYTDGIMESAIAPLIDEVKKSSPQVYIKSHPKGEERKPYLEIQLSTWAEDRVEAESRLTLTELKLKEMINR